MTQVPPSSATEGVRCPDCQYDLTGVGENRCPECGRAFEVRQVVHFGGEPARHYLVLSIIALLTIGLLGIGPLVYSIRTMSANARQDYAEARRMSRAAAIWLLVCLAALVGLMGLMVFTGISM